MKIHDLYEYVFGTRVNISEKISEDYYPRKKTAISQKFAKLKQNKKLRSLLRHTNSSTLEKILYENDPEPQTDLDYAFPTNDEILLKLKLLNKQYQYFDTLSDSIQNEFIEFLKGYALAAEFLEPELNSEDIYLQAYKLFMLFGSALPKPFNSLKIFFKKNTLSKEAPLSALLKKMPDIEVNNGLNEKDLSTWRQLILAHGIEALELFEHAIKIKQKLKTTPASLDAIRETAMRLEYKRYDENPELARLFFQYRNKVDPTTFVHKLTEDDFNQCLAIKQKDKDNLPNPIISGSSISTDLEAYQLVKLPHDDPRAFILGHIVKCCQSIGGTGAQCVIDSITQPNNGIYVLLKCKSKKKVGSPPLKAGKINYEDYDIVGEGYAWLSEFGNLTFDSWENLRPEADNPIIIEMLKKFADVIFATDPDIVRIGIGKSLKTPAFAPQLSLPESMQQGVPYIDAFIQYLIKEDKQKQSKIRAEIAAFLKENNDYLATLDFNVLQEIFLADNYTTMHCIKWIKTILRKENILLWQKLLSDKPLYSHILAQKNNRIALWYVLFEMDHHNLFTYDNLSWLIKKMHALPYLQEILLLLKKHHVLDTECLQSIISTTTTHGLLANDVRKLANLNLLTRENIQLIASNSDIIPTLQNLNAYRLLTLDNQQLLIASGIYAENVGRALTQLHESCLLTLLTYEQRQLLAVNGKYASRLVVAINKLANHDLLTTENLQAVTSKNGEYAAEIATALIKLKKNHIDSFETKFLVLNSHCEHILSIAEAFVYLLNHDLYNVENCQMIAANGKYAQNISEALYVLKNTEELFKTKQDNFQMTLLTDENRTLIAKHGESAQSMAFALAIANYLGFASKENIDEIGKNASSGYRIFSLANKFTESEALFQLLTEENFKLIIKNAPYGEQISAALDTLIEFDCLNPSLLNQLLTKPQHADNIVFNSIELKRKKLLTHRLFGEPVNDNLITTFSLGGEEKFSRKS